VPFEPLFNPVLRKTEIGSGSLLTNEWVLTAAHVVDQAASPADIEIRRGNAGDANAQVRRGIRTVIHPTWNRAAIGPNGENLCTSGAERKRKRGSELKRAMGVERGSAAGSAGPETSPKP